MTFREKLVTDVRGHFKECRWEDVLQEQIVEMLQVRPHSPYSYIHKKTSLRAKLDNSKHSTFITEVLTYCLFVDPLEISSKEFEDRILCLCVEKHQRTKLRRNEVINSTGALLLLSQAQEKQKEHFMKLVAQEVEAEHVSVSIFVKTLYSTMLYLAMKHQVDHLECKLSEIDLPLSTEILASYLANVGDNVSIMKKRGVEVEFDSDLYKVIAEVAMEEEKDA